MEISVGEAANALGVSQRRVLQLIDEDRLRARKVGGNWLVEGSSLPSSAVASRRVVCEPGPGEGVVVDV